MSTEQKWRPKKIVIVRHGESLWNTKGSKGKLLSIPRDLKGIPDHQTPLTSAGKEQARLTGLHLAKLFGEFQRVFHSDYVRARQTAKMIINEFPAETRRRMKKGMRENLALAEQNFGDLDWGVGNIKKVKKSQKEFRRRRKLIGKFRTRPPNGDSWADVCRYLESFKMEELYRPDRHGQSVLIVTHAVTMQCFRYVLEHISGEKLVDIYEQNELLNCGVGYYRWDENRRRYRLIFWNRIFYPPELKTSPP